MNNDEVEKNILEAIEILGKTIYASHKILEDRISNIVNLLTLKENEEKPEPKIYPDDVEAVSYTHLTLPTILLV